MSLGAILNFIYLHFFSASMFLHGHPALLLNVFDLVQTSRPSLHFHSLISNMGRTWPEVQAEAEQSKYQLPLLS